MPYFILTYLFKILVQGASPLTPTCDFADVLPTFCDQCAQHVVQQI